MSTKRNVSVLDNQAYQLQAEVMRGGKFNPTLRVRARAKAYNGYVNDSWYELVARTGIEHDKNHGNIIAEIHPRTFRGLLAAIRKLASNPGLDEKYTVTNANFVFLGGKRSEKQRITSKVGVGRNDKGVLGIMIIDMLDDTRPKIHFPFGYNPTARGRYSLLLKGGNEDPVESSNLGALGWVDMIEDQLNIEMEKAHHYALENAKDGDRSSGNQNKRRDDDDSSYERVSSEVTADEDLPF